MILGVMTLLIVFSVLFFNKKNRAIEEEVEESQEELLCKFVRDGSGRKIGESVSIAGDILVIKSKDSFLGVPIRHIEDKGKTLLVKGLVDLDKAYEMGEQWRNESFQVIEEKEEA